MAKGKARSAGQAEPVRYSEEWARRICERVADGDSVRTISKDPAWPAKSTIMAWLTRHEDFRKAYAVATELRAEHLAEEALEIADDSSRDTKIGERGGEVCDTEWVQRSRLRVDTRKWLAGKMAPKKWGDKQAIEHSGSIAVTDTTDAPPPETREEWLARRKREMGAAAGASG